MEEKEVKKDSHTFPYSEGVYLAIVPAFIYTQAYSYEAGYLSYFKIPSSLISIDISSLIASTLFVGLYVYALLMWLTLGSDLSQGKSNISRVVGKIMILLIFVVLLLITQEPKYIIYVMIVSFLLIAIVRQLEKFEKKHPKVGDLSKKIHLQIEEVISRDEDSDQFVLYDAFKKRGSLVFLLLIPFVIAFFAGNNVAQNKKEYDLIKHKDLGEFAIVRIYGNNIIGVPFNRVDNIMKRSYIIADIKNEKYMPIYSEKIGPLKEVKEAKN